MLTLAFAQITWAIVFQWQDVTGGSNGLIGIWPPAWLADQTVFYTFVFILTTASLGLMGTMVFAPFGLALRASRDAPQRAESMGVPVKWVQWWAFVMAGALAGLAGGLYVFAKGSVAPEVLSVTKSIDGLVMVLLGGIQTLIGPIIGAISFVGLHDLMARHTEYWRATLGGVILLLVLLFPQGLAGIRLPWFASRLDRLKS
jgi:branched-chain amino acid transport system permease protein